MEKAVLFFFTHILANFGGPPQSIAIKKVASLEKYVSKIMCLWPNGRSGCLDIDQVLLFVFMETKSRLACVQTTSISFVAQNVSESNKIEEKGDVCTQLSRGQ